MYIVKVSTVADCFYMIVHLEILSHFGAVTTIHFELALYVFAVFMLHNIYAYVVAQPVVIRVINLK